MSLQPLQIISSASLLILTMIEFAIVVRIFNVRILFLNSVSVNHTLDTLYKKKNGSPLPELPFFFFNNSGNGYFAADKKSAY